MQKWRSLHDAWWRLATQHNPRTFNDFLACSLLQLGSTAYGAIVSLRNAAYDAGWKKAKRLPVPVISIGNVTVGGTGKTACVELIARKVKALNRHPAILSRGYGGRHGTYWLSFEANALSVHGASKAEDFLADEPQMLARQLAGACIPVVVGSNRGETGTLAVGKLASNAIILDDGFQHRRLARDCDIVLVHSRMPFGGWPLFPRGPMREPLNAIKRAQIIVITKADEALEKLSAFIEHLRSINPSAAIITAIHQPQAVVAAKSGERYAVNRLQGLRVGLVSSIGDPEGFEATIRRLNAAVAWHRMFPDHHRYEAADIAKIQDLARGSRPEAVVTTEKDWVRLQPLLSVEAMQIPWWLLEVRMAILHGERELDDRLAAVFTR